MASRKNRKTSSRASSSSKRPRSKARKSSSRSHRSRSSQRGRKSGNVLSRMGGMISSLFSRK